MKQNILYEQSAIKIVLKKLQEQGYRWKNIHTVNKGRYAIIEGKGYPNIAILLKTEPFFNFGKKFSDMGYKGVGDSINTESLKEFLNANVEKVYTMFKDGKIYSIDLLHFLNKSVAWTQKEGTKVRSISIHEYTRVLR